jgi:hypothetical protein
MYNPRRRDEASSARRTMSAMPRIARDPIAERSG